MANDFLITNGLHSVAIARNDPSADALLVLADKYLSDFWLWLNIFESFLRQV